MGKDLGRTNAYHGLTLRQPSRFPVSTLLPMRLLTLIKEEDTAKGRIGAQGLLEAVSQALWEAYWEQDRDISSQDVLLDILSKVSDPSDPTSSSSRPIDWAAWLKRADTDGGIKAKLTQETQKIVELGAFGAPFFHVSKEDASDVEGQIFFGSDRLHHVAHYLGLPASVHHLPPESKL
jgi:2-hydroxychromene-2-carboxylate isomerase